MNAQPNLGMQVTTFENPMGINGFEFVEFAAPDAGLLHALFNRMGFSALMKHKSRDITVYRQGGVNFLPAALRFDSRIPLLKLIKRFWEMAVKPSVPWKPARSCKRRS